MQNEKILEAIRESTANVFSTVLSLEVAPGEASEQANPEPLNGVVALLGFTGEWTGTGLFYCHEKLACRLSSTMLMTEISEVTNDVLDGVGELANIVLGNVKDRLTELVGRMDMSIPTVIYGRNFQTRSSGQRTWLVAPFSVGGDHFEIRVCLGPKHARPAP